MKILSYNPGHDGAIVHLVDGRLEMSVEAEKDSNYRYSSISGADILNAIGELEEIPVRSVWAVGGRATITNLCTDRSTRSATAASPRRMELHTRPGDLCYEPFAGSGSQLIAGERTGRRVFGMELSEAFCDVVMERWQAFIGKMATLDRTGGTLRR